MKRYQSETIICILLILTLLFLISISSTYAKYTTTTSGTSKTVVAKFDVKSNVTEQSFGLFDTAYEEGYLNDAIIDADIVQGRIAPGTEGKFDIKITNNSDVTVDYNLYLYIKPSGKIPIGFSLNGRNYNKTAPSYGIPRTLAIGAENTHPFYWKWLFEEDDIIDTNFGMNPENITVTAKIVFRQAN